MFDIVLPRPFVLVPISIHIYSFKSLIVFESSLESVAIEQYKLSLGFMIIDPDACEDSPLAVEILALSLSASLNKIAHILILVDILQLSNAVGQVIFELASIRASISVDDTPLAFLSTFPELPDEKLVVDFVLVVSITILEPIQPFPLVILIGRIHHSDSILQVLFPVARVVRVCIIIVVSPRPLFQILLQQSFVDLSRNEDVDSLPAETVIEPAAEVDISRGISIDPLPLPDILIPHLADIATAVRVIGFLAVVQRFEFPLELVLLLLEGVGDLVGGELQHVGVRHFINFICCDY